MLGGKRGRADILQHIVTPREGATGAIAHAVIVTIDDHKTVLTFESKEDAERFAHAELARLMESEKHA
jgi:hypothetical protein